MSQGYRKITENDFNCIVTEAERYINSVWHDMKEKPDFKNCLFY